MKPRWILMAFVPLLAAGCAANLNDLRATHSGFEVELQEVGNKGARTCAPLAFAKAEAEHVFASIEFAEGDVLRAQYHMSEARKYLDVARIASQGCQEREFAPAPDYRVDPTPDRSPLETGDTVDSDADGISDANDRCPTKPEDPDGHMDDDGCPDEALSRVRMERNQVVLVEPIGFKEGTAEFDAGAYMVLSELSVLLESHADKRIRIEAHMDNSLEDAPSKTLTVQQAEAVKTYLTTQGVDATRMETMGFGSTMPIDTNRTPEGREHNRRIEIYIIN